MYQVTLTTKANGHAVQTMLEDQTKEGLEQQVKRLCQNRLNGHHCHVRQSIRLSTTVKVWLGGDLYETTDLDLFYNKEWGLWEIFLAEFPDDPERFANLGGAISQFVRYLAISE